MVIYQGNTYELPIKISIGGTVITDKDIKEVEFAIGEVGKALITKTYPEQVTFKGENFICPLTQGETFSLNPKGKTGIQIRVKFNDDSVKATGERAVTVCGAISNEVL